MKRVVIMGASSGIGYRMAEILALRGVKVGLAARRTETLALLKERYHENVEYASVDVTDSEAGQRLAELIARLGGMDIYIHSAGIGYENLGMMPEREVEIVNTNCCGFARMICCAYRYFRDNGRKGQIAAITSVAGTNGIGRLSAYSASKKFGQTYLVALEQLANEEGADICFTDIRPGWVDTPLLKEGLEYPLEMDVEYAARLILKAIVRRKRVAVVDWRWNLVAGAWRLLPDCLWARMSVRISRPDSAFPAPGVASASVGEDDV